MMSITAKMLHQHHYHPKSISQHRFVAVILTLIGLLHGIHCEIDKTISKSRGHTVTLECPIDVQSCGSLHSLKWFRGNDRVALVPGDGSSPNVEGSYSGRITIEHTPNGPHTKLFIKSVQVHDEETYTCVVTYLDPSDSCESKGSYKIKLNVLVAPSIMQMRDETGQILRNDTVIGPLSEGQRFVAWCEARGSRPKPDVGWFLDNKRLPESIPTSEGPDANGLFTEKAMLSVVLTRKEMAATFECRIDTEALETTVRHQLKVDLQVRPRKVEVSGVRQHTVQGSTVSLLCRVFGARPAANITWYNNTTPLQLDGSQHNDRITINEKSEEASDSTFTTFSQLSFTATRYENGVSFRCEADNIVMQNELEKPLSNFLYLIVMYPPVVTVSPANLLVIENGDVYLDCRYDSNPSSLKRVTWKRNGAPLVLDEHRMDGGNVNSIGLKIQQVLRTDLGNYTCELQNEYGVGTSENAINLDIHYPPIVELLMEPDTPIVERDAVNVTLMCRIISGNPATLSRVTWYLDGGILKELPECNESGDDALCGVDPDILLLENVGRHFLGNYSCEAQNLAGWGNRSADKELVVYYEPGKATLLHYPLVTSKKKSVTLFCSVEDGGNPNATQYKWFRSGSVLPYDTAMITFENLGLESRTNFSCYAYNKGGKGQTGSIALDVLAPPAFIQALQPRTAALFSTQNISLSCRVECVPLCTITWYKNGIGIEKYDERYVITETFLPADNAIGDFESVLSTLNFNISAWPDQQLDIHQDNANYSCVSSANSEGPGVRSSTDFHVEYPPENTTVSNATVDVIEGDSPPRITCAGNAYPPLQYQWLRNGTVKSDGTILHIYKPMTRDDAGIYECVSRNKHGTQSASMEINILYKPDCTITRREINDEDTLVCTAIGNPAKMSFEWTVKMENETEIMPEPSTEDTDTVSFLTINDDKGRTYRCIANNSIGIGTMCSIEITGQYHWWQHWNTNPMIIIMAAVSALLLMVIIICCIIICICRKRRQRDKYHTDVSISATHSVLSAQAATAESTASRPSAPEIPKSPPKWPLRPGVLVHVKCDTKQNLCANRAQSPFNASMNTSNLNNVSYASPLLSANSRNTSIASGKVAGGSANLSSTPITLPELPARNSTKTTNSTSAESPANSKKSSKPVARALLIDEDGVTAKVESSDDSCKEDGGCEVNGNNHSTVTVDTTTTGLLQNTTTIATANSEPNNDELLRFTSSNLIERILGRLRWRREQSNNNAHNNAANNEEGILAKSNKRAVSLLRATGWFGSGKSTNSTTGLMSDTPTKSHLQNGITCSDSARGKGKSSQGDLLTDPGEYENLPFHGLQTAPNKFYTPANAAHGNVVRVAPRQKNATSSPPSANATSAAPPTYCYNLAHSFPSSNSNSSTNTATNHLSTYPNFLHINSSNNGNSATTTALAGAQQQQQHNNKTPNNHFSSSQMPANCNNVVVIDNDPIKSTLALNNPFLAKRPKSLNQVKRNLVPRPPPPPPPPSLPPSQQQSAPSSSAAHTVSFTSLSMPRTKSIAMHCTTGDKKFNSLKSSSARKAPQFYSLRLNKCRRHQALTNPTYNTQQKLLVINNSALPYLQSSKLHHSDSEPESTSVLRKLTFSQQPLYENLVNATLEQQQGDILVGTTILDEFYCEGNDANSIYRSDSGISNSSYELTPVPAPRNNPRNCQSAPVYMNLPKYSSICGTNSKYRHENNIVAPNSKLGFATTAFNYEPLCADNFPDDFEYADMDFHNYGPINYKAASIYALAKKNKNGNMVEIRK